MIMASKSRQRPVTTETRVGASQVLTLAAATRMRRFHFGPVFSQHWFAWVFWLVTATAETSASETAEPPIRIGILLPADEPEATRLKQGATLAMEQANETSGRRVQLVIRGRPGQWGTEGDEASALALEDGAAALIAPSAGVASHQMIQVAGRTRVPVISLCADASITRTGIPWVIRIVPRAEEEARAIFSTPPNADRDRPRHWAALVPDDRAGREAARDLLAAARSTGCELDEPVRLTRKPGDWPTRLEKILAARPEGILLWTDSSVAAQLARALRQAGFPGLLAGPGRLQSGEFLQAAGKASEGFRVPTFVETEESERHRGGFADAYRRRFVREPDVTALLAYDAAFLLVELLRNSDGRPPYRWFPVKKEVQGASGKLRFDSDGNRIVTLTLRAGRKGRFGK